MRNVMVVDDSLSSARYLSMIVEGMDGYAMIGHAKTGEQAHEMFTALKPDVVFMDVILPGIDGIEATRRIVDGDSEAKVVVLSSVANQPSVKEGALKAGARDVLAKPVKPDAIIDVLAKLFG